MKKIKIIVLPFIVLAIALVISGYTKNETNSKSNDVVHTNKTIDVIKGKQHQTMNLFVTHGHCSTPFAGTVNDLKLEIPSRDDLGNPLENMRISFKIDPNTFNVCNSEELTAKIRTPDLFIGIGNEQIVFKSTNVYTMGLNWYQVNGKLSIKGVEKEVKFFVTGIRDPKETMASSLVLSGQMNLFDWGIDYDKIVNGKSDSVPTKLMYVNMKFDVLEYQTSIAGK
ncbi:YceI family protein [uncultured Kordia sp.]|uniref:YceI family protein n=1 Tax=uncultured Kordia sp. TaxID=507699 RepID=UPI00260DEE37|nr:YceI family protein [uncultured Kordia sp.]